MYTDLFWKTSPFTGKGSSETLFRKWPINQIFEKENK